ncbi:hybrid-cluster NAD(P)-dependent oxidoreductase [Loktanella sp. IMCC34160]|uniref:hybrid-cluster NAD(P)-dependent oxidoreductase n=1 Tax=Loktanella sp. IMCC34160 TaxID=2510646 RepID=UPI00101BF70D|nr:hybrid-cluster NAD(P)-dependent oxidoreductase [Loktanella sp. IMCC34160]RYG91976.1 hybrid-cluster NAD(P)-dependent oxidoreductase [Loktanella sp. IMCC34160]
MGLQANFTALEEAAIWSDSEPLECVTVVPEAPNTATFSFRAASGATFRFRPGQFLTLELPVPGETIWRTYTISSSPSRPLSISVTVKAQEGSIGTRWMLDHLRPGMRIKASGPAGIFTLPQPPEGKYLFISAGSGITPSLSMTQYLFDRGQSPDICVVNCARSPSEIIARRQFEHMAARVPGIKIHWVVEQDDPYGVWTGYRGRLTQIMLGMMAQDYMDRDVYCCGPEPFMQAVREMLIGLGYDMSRYNQESFQAPVEEAADAPELDDVIPEADALAEVMFSLSGKSATCRETDTVLSVAKAAGLNIPSGCTFGICGTCKVRKTEGEVVMVHNGGISDDDIEAGYILACCSKPQGRVAIDV